MRVAVVQPKLKLGAKDANLRTIARHAALLGRSDVDIACFPELATTSYALYEQWRKHSEPIPGPSTDLLGKVARENGLYLVVGMPEKGEGQAIYDSAVLVNPEGEVDGTYRKIHLWDRERKYFTRGDRFLTFETRHGKLGIGICYDIEFPEASRTMALAGAKLLLFPSAQPRSMRPQIDVYAKSRAAENCVFVGFSNTCGVEADQTYLGRSQITSPGCEVLAMVKSSTGSAVADIDLRELDEYRTRLPYLEQRVPLAY